MRSNFLQLIDQKKTSIETLMQGIEQGENQRRNFQQRHSQKFSEINNLYQQKVVEMHTEYMRNISVLKEKYDSNLKNAKSEHSNSMKHLEVISHTLHKKQSAEELKAKIDFRGWKDELKNKVCIVGVKKYN